MTTTEERTVDVPAISCGHCVNTIEREVGGLPGVHACRADAATRRVTVSWDPETSDWVAIEHHMADIGYPPEG